MAGHTNVQEYLQKHNIGGLFEELMGRVVSDQPDDPLPFLIRILERKANKAGQMRRSMGDLRTSYRSRSPEGLNQTAPPGASWGESTGDMAVAKSRDYGKPWKSNVKRTSGVGKKSATLPASTAGRKATNVDELWEGQGQRSGKRRPGSPSRPVSAWGARDQDEDIYESYGYEGPRRRAIDGEDDLSGELSVAPDRTRSSAKQRSTVSTMSSKRTGHQASSIRHKQQLERLIMEQKSVSSRDSGFEDDKDAEIDDAVELMEDVDDLQNEGITKLKNKRGVRISKTSRKASSSKAEVKIAICARCAKVMSGGEPSEPAKGRRYGELPDFDYDSGRELADSRPQSAGAMSDEDEEEFESVSQVSGPRHPVWQPEDSDGESLAARKGKHMFASSKFPVKGRPMYSGTMPEPTKSGVTNLFQSEDIQRNTSSPTAERGVLSRTWAPGTTQSDDDEEVASEAGFGVVASVWESPAGTDYETDATSSVYDKSKGRKYMGAF